jgi:hypothetical protein
MCRLLIVAAACAAAFAAGATASPVDESRCASATPIDPSAPLGRAVPLGDVLWLAVYPYAPGHPTKAIVWARRPLAARVVLRGWDCATGRRLRFWYREGQPFQRLPASAAAMRRRGSLSATFGPWPAQAMTGGYLMFWRAGLWKIVAYEGGAPVGTVTVRAAPL